MSGNKGKIRLKPLHELQSTPEHIELTELKTPEKKKKAGKVRAATTQKKHKELYKNDQQIVANRTAIKRSTRKDQPPNNQLRIDSFFKSAAKTFKVETLPSPSTTKLNINTSQRKPKQKGRKRLFDEETTSESESNLKSVRLPKRAHLPRKAKTVMDLVCIDLCSDPEDVREVKGESPSSEKTIITKEDFQSQVFVTISPQIEPVYSKRQYRSTEKIGSQAPVVESKSLLATAKVQSPMVEIPLQNLAGKTSGTPSEIIAVGASSKENVPIGRRRKSRLCPPYKVIQGTTFAVDGFQFGDIPNVTHYFLTHYHADHYVGLTRKFQHPLYMSPTTARLVRTFIPIDNKYIFEMEIDNPFKLNNIEITAIDANHCPGAIMLFFKLPSGECILHTGDFRASFEMESLPIFWNYNVDLLYLDTTYLSSKYEFCHQTESIDRTLALVREFRKKNALKRILYVCGSYIIGKEKVWQALADEFNLSVWTEPHRRKAIDCLQWPELNLRLYDNEDNADLHILTMGRLSYPRLVEYFEKFSSKYDMLLAIRPSGWEKDSKPSYGKKISIIGVEYSEHSSYKELERFVRFLKPKRVISTVPVNRDLFLTGKVPEKWYRFTGIPAMLSNGYQPSISTYLKTPNTKPKCKIIATGTMTLSPFKNENEHFDDGRSEIIDLVSEIDASNGTTPPNKVIKVEKTPSRITSDASDDWLA